MKINLKSIIFLGKMDHKLENETFWGDFYFLNTVAKNQELWFLKVCSFYDITWPQPGFDNYNGAAAAARAKFNLEPERK